MSLRARAGRVLRELAKWVGLVVVAGGGGAALGYGISELWGDEPAESVLGQGTTSRTTSAATSATTASAPTRTGRTAPTALTAPATAAPQATVRVTVLDARLFTNAAPSGTQEQPGRMTVRVRAENPGPRTSLLLRPTLRVGTARVPPDPASDADWPESLASGASQTVTLRFTLQGEATPKVVRDRRARILIAGQSVPMRVRVRAGAA